MRYLLGTSALTRLRATSIVRQIEQLDGDGLARRTVTDLEVGFSARGADEWDRLAAEGRRGRKVPDLLIAAVAEATSLTVLHYDVGFDHIAAITGQPTQWIVERGSID